MFKRLEFEQFHELVPFLVFGFTAAIFLFIFMRALKMRPGTAERLAALPLDDGRNCEGEGSNERRRSNG